MIFDGNYKFKQNSVLISVFIALLVLTAAIPMINASPEDFTYDPETNTWTVFPTNVDDTENLQAVFDMADPGSTIQLVEGTYIISETITIFDFEGTVKGAGMDYTIIRSLGDDNFGVDYVPWGSFFVPFCDFFTFLYVDRGLTEADQVSIAVSDMSFLAIGDTEEYFTHGAFTTQLYSFINVIGFAESLDDLSYVNVAYNALRFTGQSHSVYRSNVLLAVNMEYLVKSTVDVTGCVFEDIDWIGIFLGGLPDSTITVGGSPHAKNTFIRNNFPSFEYSFGGMDYSAIFFYDLHNAFIEVSHCETFDWNGVRIMQGPNPFYVWDESPSSFYIAYNTFRQPSNYASDFAGIELIDLYNYYFEIPTLDTVIEHNTIISDMHIIPSGPIFGAGVKDAVVKTNIFRGAGTCAIYIWGDEWGGIPSSGWMLLGNNLEGFDGWFADIYLGTNTTGCTVVGGDLLINVANYGTDNILVGVNNMGGNAPGPEIKEAMERSKTLVNWRPI